MARYQYTPRPFHLALTLRFVHSRQEVVSLDSRLDRWVGRSVPVIMRTV